MKTVEFIFNSTDKRVDESEKFHEDSSPVTATGASDAQNECSCFDDQTQREIVASVLKKFTDVLAIYRSTLDNRIHAITSDDLDAHLNHFQTMIKLRDDSVWVSGILDDLIKEIESKGRYDVLIREIQDHEKERDEEMSTVANYEETMKNLDVLGKLFERETQAHALQKEQLRTKLIFLKNEMKKVQHTVNVELKYVKSEEEAKCEAHALRCSLDFEGLRDKQKKISSKENNEIRVAREIEKFLEKNIIENGRAASEWRKRYERETSTYASEIQRLTEEIESKEKTFATLQTQHRERQEFIDTYMAEKETARELKKREAHRRDCAIKIEAWWRGVMVRRKLGPYRPDERKKKRAVKSKK